MCLGTIGSFTVWKKKHLPDTLFRVSVANFATRRNYKEFSKVIQYRGGSFALRASSSDCDLNMKHSGFADIHVLRVTRPTRIVEPSASNQAYGVVMLCGVGGLVLSREPRTASLFLFFIAAYVVPTLVTFAITRFRLPFMPLLMISAAPALFSLRERTADTSRMRLTLALIASLVTLAIIVEGHLTSPV
jgi:hypothetical protein